MVTVSASKSLQGQAHCAKIIEMYCICENSNTNSKAVMVHEFLSVAGIISGNISVCMPHGHEAKVL